MSKSALLESEALSRARSGHSFSNYPTIIRGFIAKGIAPHDIEPRVNVLTYRAWRAEGHQVRKGESGVKVVTYVPTEKKKQQLDGSIKVEVGKRPWTATVFHVSQTDPVTA